MVSSNIAVTHASTGLVVADVTRAERISSHVIRITLGGDALADWEHVGFDQWFRLAVPTSDAARFDNLSDRFGVSGYLKYLTLPRSTRPVIRNYTVREFRPDTAELDVDFVIHGGVGIAGPWAERLPVGDTVGLIDQGAGFRHKDAADVLLVGDESAMPAVLGILRDLDRNATGTAVIEVPAADDVQPDEAPDGVDVRWIIRSGGDRPGTRALEEVTALVPAPTVRAFSAGESRLATGARRHLVSGCGVPKENVAFCGYYKLRPDHA
ncbi:siderophore-interacting protein [Microbacterium gorillae]|uniref:siderophore-interacting protein n=1 Tax=Microbacterium gorillae TaxID=1231063 RepID=UPI000590D490|nr:siderophore-interacting protein [Microbacterium gorillae]